MILQNKNFLLNKFLYYRKKAVIWRDQLLLLEKKKQLLKLSKYFTYKELTELIFLKKQQLLLQKRKINIKKDFRKFFEKVEQKSTAVEEVEESLFSLETILTKTEDIILVKGFDTLQFRIPCSRGFFSEWFNSLSYEDLIRLRLLDKKYFLIEGYLTKEVKRNFPKQAEILNENLKDSLKTNKEIRDKLSNFAINNLIWENIVNVGSAKPPSGVDAKVYYELFCGFHEHGIKYFIENNYHEPLKKRPEWDWGFPAFSDLFYWIMSNRYLERGDLLYKFYFQKYDEFFLTKILMKLINTWNCYGFGESLTFYISLDQALFFKLSSEQKDKVDFKIPGIYNLAESKEVEVTKKKGWEFREKHHFKLNSSTNLSKVVDILGKNAFPVTGFYLTFKPEYGTDKIANTYQNNTNTVIYFYDKFKQSRNDYRYTSSRKINKTSLGIHKGSYRLEIRLGLLNYWEFLEKEFSKVTRQNFNFTSFTDQIGKKIHKGLWKFICNLSTENFFQSK